jgi:hypothetical protein
MEANGDWDSGRRDIEVGSADRVRVERGVRPNQTSMRRARGQLGFENWLKMQRPRVSLNRCRWEEKERADNQGPNRILAGEAVAR